MTTIETAPASTTTASDAATPGDAHSPDDGVPRPSDTVDEFVERVFAALLGTQEVQAIYLGDRLGWYRALADGGPMTSVELAAATGTHERYAREWLEHQAVCGYVTVDDGPTPPPPSAATRCRRPTPRRSPTSDSLGLRRARSPDASPASATPLDRSPTPTAPAAASAGTSSATTPARPRRRPTGRCSSAGWARTTAGGPRGPRARSGGRPGRGRGLRVGLVVDRPRLAYPGATVDGYDVDGPSVEAASRNAPRPGLADRVQFDLTDGSATDATDGTYDAVLAFECIHDMADPVAVLARMRRLVADDGVVVVMDERRRRALRRPGRAAERMLYGFCSCAACPTACRTSTRSGRAPSCGPRRWLLRPPGRVRRGGGPRDRGRVLPLLPAHPLGGC